MRKKLNWIDVLNEQARWHGREDLTRWFFELVGRRAALLDGTIEGFEEALGYMRRQVANVHFRQPVDLMWLDTQLKTVTLGLLHHQGAQEGADSQLPHFRARVKGLHDTDLLRAVKDTLLVQFAEFIGESMDSAISPVSRCEGLHRQGAGQPAAAMLAGSAGWCENEQRWRQEMPLLAAGTESLADVQRCANFFVGSPKARFCSDACRFSAFQLAKSVQEPAYLAEKQRRYRRKREKGG